MAAQEPPYGQPQTAQQPVIAQGLLGVVGTAGIKAALVTDERTERPAVELNQRQQQLHRQIPPAQAPAGVAAPGGWQGRGIGISGMHRQGPHSSGACPRADAG